jgi:hypothetical protein
MANATNSCPTELPAFCQQRHWSIYWIFIACAMILVGGRVVTLQNFYAQGDTVFHSANDRSRWATVRSLVDHGTYEIDDVIKPGQSINWHTIDQVRHIGADGRMHVYSSKPTLYPTMVAGVYWVIKKTTGMSITEHPLWVPRLILLFTNVLPWGLFLFFLAKLIDRVPVRDWTRYYILGVAGFGTFLTTFSVTLNNHLPAAFSVTIAAYFLCRIWWKQRSDWLCYFVTGLFAAFAAANELPALSFLAMAGLACAIRSMPKTIVAFVPGVAVVVAGFFGTNFLAHGEWKPPYTHRGDGEVAAEVVGDFKTDLDAGKLPSTFEDQIEDIDPDLEFRLPMVVKGDWPSTPADLNRWVVRNRASDVQYAITNPIGTDKFEIRLWSNWYEYPESYWLASRQEMKSEVDRGQEDQVLYAFHVLFGHHGIFSLTPAWLLAFAGMVCLLWNKRLPLRSFAAMTLLLTIVVICFYVLYRPAMDRNYGGVTSGLRWMFWLAPLWLVCMLPIVEWLGRTRNGRFVCVALLLISGLSAFYSVHNPWVHPWLYEIWQLTGLPR